MSEQKHGLSEIYKTGVYILYNNNEPVYVGQTINGYSRIFSHIKNKEFTHFTFIELEKKFLDAEEARLIRLYRPIHNKSIPSLIKKKNKCKVVKNKTLEHYEFPSIYDICKGYMIIDGYTKLEVIDGKTTLS